MNKEDLDQPLRLIVHHSIKSKTGDIILTNILSGWLLPGMNIESQLISVWVESIWHIGIEVSQANPGDLVGVKISSNTYINDLKGLIFTDGSIQIP